jgi:hypothetical protein
LCIPLSNSIVGGGISAPVVVEALDIRGKMIEVAAHLLWGLI